MSNFDLPTEYDLQSIKIDGNDVSGLLVSLSVFENIYSPIITGHLSLLETDTAAFIEKYKIEGKPLLGIDIQVLNEALTELKPEHLELLILRYFDGLSTIQIGEKVGYGAPRVRSTLFRARKKIKRSILKNPINSPLWLD